MTEPADEVFKIRAGSRKAALVHLGLAAWREHLFDTKDLAEPRGRKVDEAGLQRTLYRSSIGEIEHLDRSPPQRQACDRRRTPDGLRTH